MPRFTAESLRNIAVELFQAAGCSDEDARTVADHLVESNLFGHDSHGAIRMYEYVLAIREGRFLPKAKPRIVDEAPSTAVVDAGGAMGPVGGSFATRTAIAKARQNGVAAVALRNTSHVGRVGAYPLMAAREGMMAMVMVNGGRLGYQIAPYGGLDGKLGTNPIAVAAPRPGADPILVDMTTSVVAEGKVRLAINQGKSVPEGWLIDHDGNPTTDPRIFLAEKPGSILPLGGPVAYKGYGLGLIVDILSGTLSGQGCAAGERKLQSNGVLITVYHIEHFTDRARYDEEVENLVRHVRSSRLAPGFDEILLPGEPEFRTAARRRKEGIEIDETTWSRTKEAAGQVGLDASGWDAMAIET
jgi:uncharacterized oxidoreductase